MKEVPKSLTGFKPTAVRGKYFNLEPLTSQPFFPCIFHKYYHYIPEGVFNYVV
jgi:hypothetical protein